MASKMRVFGDNLELSVTKESIKAFKEYEAERLKERRSQEEEPEPSKNAILLSRENLLLHPYIQQELFSWLDKEALKNVRQVCTDFYAGSFSNWKNIVTARVYQYNQNYPNDLNNVENNKGMSMEESLGNECLRGLRKFKVVNPSLASSAHMSPTELSFWLKYGPQMTALTVEVGDALLNNTSWGAELSWIIVHQCKNLNMLCIHAENNWYAADFEKREPLVNQVASKAVNPNLEVLYVNDHSNFFPLLSHSIKSFSRIFSVMPNLQEIIMKSCGVVVIQALVAMKSSPPASTLKRIICDGTLLELYELLPYFKITTPPISLLELHNVSKSSLDGILYLQSLLGLDSLKTLETLRLNFDNSPDVYGHPLMALDGVNIPFLRSLDITMPNIHLLQIFPGVQMSFDSLRKLAIRWDVTENANGEYFQIFSDEMDFPCLKELRLSLGSRGAFRKFDFTELNKFPKLEVLHIVTGRVDLEPLDSFATILAPMHLIPMPNEFFLRQLPFFANEQVLNWDSSLAEIKNILFLPQVREFKVFPRFTSEGWQVLGNWFPNVRLLHLFHSSLKPDTFSDMSSTFKYLETVLKFNI